ncbi:MAG: hypothetical protein BYD32DRAFT_476206 [Podila humilis]|nr:MAG: hypothetical protein BYD32DRAFT_476206 [Podila humilis]
MVSYQLDSMDHFNRKVGATENVFQRRATCVVDGDAVFTLRFMYNDRTSAETGFRYIPKIQRRKTSRTCNAITPDLRQGKNGCASDLVKLSVCKSDSEREGGSSRYSDLCTRVARENVANSLSGNSVDQLSGTDAVNLFVFDCKRAKTQGPFRLKPGPAEPRNRRCRLSLPDFVSGVVATVLLGLVVVRWERRRVQKACKEQTAAANPIETKEEPGHEPSHHLVNTPKF